MYLHKVVRKLSFGFKKVFSLVLSDTGLSIIYTGNVGGLPEAFSHINSATTGGGVVGGAGAAVGIAAATPIIRKFQEELARNEKSLMEKGPEGMLSAHKKNAQLSFSDITEVDFKEGKLFKKKFVFSVNEKKYVRIQNRSLKNYEVFLDCISQNRKIKIDDPFEVYASRFINFCTNVSNFQKDEFNESSYNLNLMAKILLIN